MKKVNTKKNDEQNKFSEEDKNLEPVANTSNKNLKRDENKQDCLTEPNIKIRDLSVEVRAQQKYFEEALKYVTTEKQKLEESLRSLEDGVSISSIFERIWNRLDAVRKDAERPTVHGNIFEFMKNICDYLQKAWMGAGRINYSGQLTDRSHVNTKEMFDWVEIFLHFCERVIETTLIRIKFMLDSMNMDQNKAKSFSDRSEELEGEYNELWQETDDILQNFAQKRPYDPIKADLLCIQLNFHCLFHNFEYTYENDYQTYVVKKQSDVLKESERST